MAFNVFKDKKVLVTGHTGFKGAWLTLWLYKLGAIITGISLDPKKEKDAFYAMNITSLCNDLRIDINNYDDVKTTFDAFRPDMVFHLAAQALVLESYEAPLNTFNTNIIGSANVLEACRHTPSVKTVIMVTSDKCYDNKNWLYGYRENDALGGKDPYSASKSCAEYVINSYRDSFFAYKPVCSIASVRAGNVIGGGDWADNRIIPDCIKSIMNGEPVILRNPTAVRPWQHVIEPLGGYLLLAARMSNDPGAYNEPWNFGPGHDETRSVEDLVVEVIKHWGTGTYNAMDVESKKTEEKLLRLDISKARQKLKWKPILNFTESVKMTVDWYKLYLENEDMFTFSLRQINEYENRLDMLG